VHEHLIFFGGELEYPIILRKYMWIRYIPSSIVYIYRNLNKIYYFLLVDNFFYIKGFIATLFFKAYSIDNFLNFCGYVLHCCASTEQSIIINNIMWVTPAHYITNTTRMMQLHSIKYNILFLHETNLHTKALEKYDRMIVYLFCQIFEHVVIFSRLL